MPNRIDTIKYAALNFASNTASQTGSMGAQPYSPRDKTRTESSMRKTILALAGFAAFAFLIHIGLLARSKHVPNIAVLREELRTEVTELLSGRSAGSTVSELKEELYTLRADYKRLETRLNAFTMWNVDPHLGMHEHPELCSKHSQLNEFECGLDNNSKECAGLYDHPVCLDNFPPKGRTCIVYDFGIRAQPEFGKVLSGHHFNCDVFAYDPSPVSIEFFQSPKGAELAKKPNYHFFPVGAGHTDGPFMLNEYNWDQVSIINIPRTTERREDGKIKLKPAKRGKVKLNVQRIDTLMKNNGHDHIDVLKVDVEGSEYMFLDVLIETRLCERVDQLVLEWHHFDFDVRYGGGASPQLNMYVAALEECGLHQWWVHDTADGGWLSLDPNDQHTHMTLRYNLASFIRRPDDKRGQPANVAPSKQY